jgi:hypothetical protein
MFIGLGLQNVPETLHFRVIVFIMLQPFFNVFSTQINPADYSFYKAILFDKFKHKMVVFFRLAGLNNYRSVYFVALQYGLKIDRHEIAPYDGHVGSDPIVPYRVKLPKVLVCINF